MNDPIARAPSPSGSATRPRHLLITAGPTHEPIDAVRFLGNRSSGRLGVALADEAARRGHTVTLLLGPVPRTPADSRVTLHRFRTTADLQQLLARHMPACDVLIMAAAVADYRPRIDPDMLKGKLRRQPGTLTLELEPTPDQIALCSKRRTPGQVLVGFALEPRDELMTSARAKLDRKDIDMIVANPLESMESDAMEATVIERTGRTHSTPGVIAKTEFARWLLAIVESYQTATPAAPACQAAR